MKTLIFSAMALCFIGCGEQELGRVAAHFLVLIEDVSEVAKKEAEKIRVERELPPSLNPNCVGRLTTGCWEESSKPQVPTKVIPDCSDTVKTDCWEELGGGAKSLKTNKKILQL